MMLMTDSTKARPSSFEVSLERKETNARLEAANAIRKGIRAPLTIQTIYDVDRALEKLAVEDSKLGLPIARFPYTIDYKTNQVVFGKESIESLLQAYNLGRLEKIENVEGSRDDSQRGYAIRTAEGMFYIKQFNNFDKPRRNSLFLIEKLKRIFPTVKLVETKENFPYVVHRGIALAVFCFLDINEELKLNPSFARGAGRDLGQFHVFTSGSPIRFNDLNEKALEKFLFHGYTKDSIALSPEQKRLIERAIMSWHLDIPAGEPKAICHVEFLPKHFSLDETQTMLNGLIDFDYAQWDFMARDLGTLMSAAVITSGYQSRIDFKSLALVLYGYNEARPLTEWEKTHLYEIMLYGIVKPIAWDRKPGKEFWNYEYISKLDAFFLMTREEFDTKLRAATLEIDIQKR